MFRQGDILIIAVDTIPTEAQPLKLESGRITLAYGEVTGHSHQVAVKDIPAVKWFGVADDMQYLQAAAPFRIEHQEHGALELPSGAYAVIRQVEYTPEELRRVAD